MTDAQAAAPTPGPSKRNRLWIRIAVTLVVVGGLAYTQRARLVGVQSAITSVSGVALLVSAALNLLATIVLPAIVSQQALRTERLSIPLRELIRVNFVTRFYSLVVPKGGVMAVRWHMYRKAGSGGDALALVVFEKLAIFVVYVLAAVVFLAVERHRLGPAGDTTLVVTVGLAVTWVGLLLPFFVKSLRDPQQRFIDWIGRFAPQSIHQRLSNIGNGINAFQSLPRSCVWNIWLLSLASYVCFVLSGFVLAQGMGIELTLVSMAWIRSLMFVITLLPFTVGGLGLREVGYATFMGFYGISTAQAVAFGLVLFFVQCSIGVLGGVFQLTGPARQPSPARPPPTGDNG